MNIEAHETKTSFFPVYFCLLMQFTGYFINDAVIFRYFKSLSTTCNGCKTCKNACLLLVVLYQQKGAQLCYKIYLSLKKGTVTGVLTTPQF